MSLWTPVRAMTSAVVGLAFLMVAAFSMGPGAIASDVGSSPEIEVINESSGPDAEAADRHVEPSDESETAASVPSDSATEEAAEAVSQPATEPEVPVVLGQDEPVRAAVATVSKPTPPRFVEIEVPGCGVGMLCTVCLAGCPTGHRDVIVHATRRQAP